MTEGINDELRSAAEAQDGLFTTAQARSAGYDKWSLCRLVKAGACVHLCRGVYAACDGVRRTPEQEHGRLSRAALLVYPDALLSGHSALNELGLPVWGADLARAHLERNVRHEVLTQRFVIRPRLVTELQESERCEHPAVAVVQHCLESGASAGIVAADAGIHASVLTVDDLEVAARAIAGWARSSRVRTMLAHADGRSESPGESRLRFGLTVAGVETEPQVLIRDDLGYAVGRVDLLVKGTRVVVEFDGKVKYADGNGETLWQEKRREDGLRRLGYTVVRVIWADLYDMPKVIRWVRAAVIASEKGAPHPGSLPG